MPSLVTGSTSTLANVVWRRFFVVRRRDSHQTVDAVLASQACRRRCAAFDLDDCAVKADAFTGDHVERLDLPAFLLGIRTYMHTAFRPILGLEAAP